MHSVSFASQQNVNSNLYSKMNSFNNREFLKEYVNYASVNKISKKNIIVPVASISTFLGVIGAVCKNKIDYKTRLLRGIEKEMHIKIDKSKLAGIVDKKELLRLLKNLKEENFVASKENIASGIFCADLHSHTWRSDGWGIVENIMNEAAEYADNLYNKTGKKFLFSITDHDTIEGTKEAIKLIVSNPEKYKNIKFVPGVELSFIQNTDSGFEGAELLVHCIDPFSKKLNSFINQLQNKRAKMIEKTISELKKHFGDSCFAKEDMDEFYLKRPNENFVYNLHLRVLNYAQVKNKVNELALNNNLDSSILYQDLMSKWRVGKNDKSLNNFLRFLSLNGYDSTIPENSNIIEEICKNNFPKIENGKIIAPSENTYEDIVEFFSKDDDVVVGFAHPAFTFKSFLNYQKRIGEMIEKSKGVIKTTEKYHQSYAYPIKNGAITQGDIDGINFSIDKYGLLNLGGRDNHSAHFLDKIV